MAGCIWKAKERGKPSKKHVQTSTDTMAVAIASATNINIEKDDHIPTAGSYRGAYVSIPGDPSLDVSSTLAKAVLAVHNVVLSGPTLRFSVTSHHRAG